jgi:hypothetical protein
MIDMRPVPSAVLAMSEVEAAIRKQLGEQSLKDFIAAG